MPRGYIRQMLSFPTTHSNISHVLKAGLAKLVADIPYLLSAVVINEENHHYILLAEPYQTVDDLYSEQDCSDTVNYTVMREEHFPPSMFSGPGMTPPETQPPFSNPTPVFRARVSFVQGGIVLCVAVHHCTTDITGFGVILKTWASHCQRNGSTATIFDPMWMDHSILLKHYDMNMRKAPSGIPKLLHIRGPDDHARLANSRLYPDDFTTDILFFPQKTLQTLKHAVNEHITSQGVTGWVSTGDIITALLWSAILVAEHEWPASEETPRTQEEKSSTIGFPVNIRLRANAPLPSDYIGAAFVMTAAMSARDGLISFAMPGSPLGDDELIGSNSIGKLAKIASTIRISLRQVDEKSIQDALEYLNAAPDDHPPITLGPRHDSISIVSWADQAAYEIDWGEAIGKCDAVRLPKLRGKRYPIILPRSPAGINDGEEGLEVIVSLEKQALEKFEQSWPIRRFAIVRCSS